MLRRKERLLYRGVIVSLIVVMSAVVTKSNDNYNKQLEVVEQTYQALEKMQQHKDEVIKEWEKDYYQLTLDYQNLVYNYDLVVSLHDSYALNESNINIKEYNLSEEDIYLLAQCVQAEAGIVPYSSNLEQQYICQVILNRYNSDEFPNTIKEVIYQKINGIPQFSVAYDGMLEKQTELDIKTLANVYKVLANGTDLPEYVLYFYSSSLTENWVCNLNTYVKCKRTIFAYADNKGGE